MYIDAGTGSMLLQAPAADREGRGGIHRGTWPEADVEREQLPFDFDAHG